MTVGAVVRSLRESAGLKQRELANRVGISPALLSLIEHGRRDPTVRVLRDIGRALGVPPATLVAVALRDEAGVASSPEAQRLSEAVDHLMRAAHHFVLGSRLKQDAVHQPHSRTEADRQPAEAGDELRAVRDSDE